MNDIIHKPWFKVIALLAVVFILYLVFINSQGGGLLVKKTLPPTDVIDFPEDFAAFGSDNAVLGLAESRGLAPSPPIFDQGAGTTGETDAKIIQNGYLTIEVDDSQAALDEMEAIANKYDGFLINKNFHESNIGQKSASAQIKVPFAKFNDAINDIKDYANFLAQENINSQDVTEEYTDLKSQLKNLSAEEDQYLQIMKQAFKIEDILNVTARLSDVRGRIERIEGRIKYYDARTDFSIINIQITEELLVKAPSHKWRPWQVIKKNAGQLVVSLQDFVDNIIGFAFWLIGIIPYLVLLAIVFWVVRVIRNKRIRDKGVDQGDED